MDRLSYVVDGSLGAVPLNRMRFIRPQIRTGPNPIVTDRPLMVGSQQLEANILYDSSNPGVRYYLPLYKVASTGGKPEIELHYTGGEEDGDVGRLAIKLTWDPPAAPAGIQLRAIDHLAEIELRFLIPVQNAGTAAGKDTIALQPLQQVAGGKAESITIFPHKEQFDAVYQAMRDSARQATIHIKIKARVGVKTWQQVVVGGSAGKEQQADALIRRGALFTKMLNPETLATLKKSGAGASRGRVIMQAAKPDEVLRVGAMRKIMGRPELKVFQAPAALQPQAAATPIAKTPIFTANVGALQMNMQKVQTTMSSAAILQTMPVRAASAASMRVLAPSIRMARVMPFAGLEMTAQPMMAQPFVAQPLMAQQIRAAAFEKVTAQRQMNVMAQVSAAPMLSAATLSMVNTPVLATAMSLSDLRVENRVALPIQIALGNQGEPAIIDTELESQQEFGFRFDPFSNPEVFATQGFASGGIHLLLALLLSGPDGRTHTVFQDNLMREVVHVAPAQFRLVRANQAPYLPGLRILPADFTATDHDNEADVIFQVAINYQLEPWIDPDTIELARAALASQHLIARFTPILPREAKLTLSLDLLGDAQSRTTATVEPASGIADTLVLGRDAFANLWRNHLAQPGVGIGGNVAYQLFDGSHAESSVSLSFWETSADVFDVDFVGQVGGQPGRYRVRVRNRIESAVNIERLPAAVLSGGAVANAVDAGTVLNRKLKPQEAVEIDYLVTPPEAPVSLLSPLVFGTVEPNLNALLKVLMLSPGYNSMSFTVPVKAADGVFTKAGEAEPLTGLLVEFDDGTKTQVTAEAPMTEVSLVGRLADQLQGQVDDQHKYLYRVTNLHVSGEGARTNWREGQGTTLLELGTAVVQLDF